MASTSPEKRICFFLWKLNPAREGEIKPTSDYPKGNYAAVREKPGNFWVVDRWQRQADVPFADVVSAGKPIVPQIEAWANTQSIILDDGWKVDVAREAKRRALAAKNAFDSSVLAKWKEIFVDLLETGA